MQVPDRLKSRKLWVTVAAAVVSMVYPELIPLLKFLVPSYVVAQGAADAAASLK